MIRYRLMGDNIFTVEDEGNKWRRVANFFPSGAREFN